MEEIYSIEFTDQARKQFLKLEKEIQKRIKNTLLRIKVRPFSYVKKLVGDASYRLRAGDYRIIMDISKKKLVILVLKIKHRKDVYKNL
jgi:mRNA interferase RelE/StbE